MFQGGGTLCVHCRAISSEKTNEKVTLSHPSQLKCLSIALNSLITKPVFMSFGVGISGSFHYPIIVCGPNRFWEWTQQYNYQSKARYFRVDAMVQQTAYFDNLLI